MPNVLMRELEIVLSDTDVQAAAAEKLGSKAQYRRGEPLTASYMRKKLGDDGLARILQDLLQVQISKAMADCAAASGIEVESTWNMWDQPLRYTYRVRFEVFPEFDIAGLDMLTLPVLQPVLIDDAQVDAFIEIMRRDRSPWHPVERPSQIGDRVIVNFEGLIDGHPFPGGRGTAAQISLGAGGMLPEFEHALTGVASGASPIQFPVVFPENYDTPFLVGKTAQFTCTILTVHAIDLLPLDEQFAGRFGARDLAALRADMRTNLEQQHREQDLRDISNHLLGQLAVLNNIPLPNSLMQQSVMAIQADTARQAGKEVDDVVIDDTMLELARNRTHIGILVRQIVKTQGIKIDPERLEQRLAGVDEKLRRNPEVIRQITAEMTQDCVIDWLIAKASANQLSSSSSSQ